MTATTTALPPAGALRGRSLWPLVAWGVLIALLAASWRGADMRPLDLVRASENMARYAADFFPPNFAQWRLYLEEMIVTLQIAVWGTRSRSSPPCPSAWHRHPTLRLLGFASRFAA